MTKALDFAQLATHATRSGDAAVREVLTLDDPGRTTTEPLP